jgi:hypothetical protein
MIGRKDISKRHMVCKSSDRKFKTCKPAEW